MFFHLHFYRCNLHVLLASFASCLGEQCRIVCGRNVLQAWGRQRDSKSPYAFLEPNFRRLQLRRGEHLVRASLHLNVRELYLFTSTVYRTCTANVAEIVIRRRGAQDPARAPVNHDCAETALLRSRPYDVERRLLERGLPAPPSSYRALLSQGGSWWIPYESDACCRSRESTYDWLGRNTGVFRERKLSGSY